ncbi:hypothetical protein [Streptomyces sp. NBC_00847]|uniref:hypothetical protein n=1 Tax=unclassified Streptomyces TaxID=2593676 RepID=UPI002B1E7215|nr:hypothetical protein [Streptomyces sp. NBC_00847]
MRELEASLPGATKPYAGVHGLPGADRSGRESQPARDRVSCCGFSTVRPEGTCAPCPRTCDADPVTKLRAAAAS